MLFALSIVSINCSKFSKAMTLFSRVMSGESMAAIDSFIKSASVGPPRRDLRISGSRGRLDARSALGSVVEVGSAEGFSEFSIPHLRS